MPVHDAYISSLPAHHRRRLQWFSDNSGSTQPLPEPVADGPLITRAKGIYKPAGLEYALSARVMISSPYADKAVEWHHGGGWSLRYF